MAERAKELGASVGMPRIDCGLEGGKWDRIESIILDILAKNSVATYVLDFE